MLLPTAACLPLLLPFHLFPPPVPFIDALSGSAAHGRSRDTSFDRTKRHNTSPKGIVEVRIDAYMRSIYYVPSFALPRRVFHQRIDLIYLIRMTAQVDSHTKYWIKRKHTIGHRVLEATQCHGWRWLSRILGVPGHLWANHITFPRKALLTCT